jgi:hypothetical protein
VSNLKKIFFIDQLFSNIGSEYKFYVDYLYFDKDIMRLAFRMFPAFSSYVGIPLIMWSGLAKDNLNNSYEYVGGACGKSIDGTHTEGVISFAPLPHKDANRLDVDLVSEGIDPVVECKLVLSLF